MNIEEKSILVKEKIEEDFKSLNEQDLEKFFDKFMEDEGNRALSFSRYYNRTVLDKERIVFSEFNSLRAWATHCSKTFYSFFDKNYDSIVQEIKIKKDIREFFDKYCYQKDIFIKDGKELKKSPSSFCSKLFHTILPNEFPPVDNPIKDRFNLKKEDFIDSVLIIKEGYELFIKENQNKMLVLRKILSKPKFAELRVNELSDIRILDMYYWFKENRNKKW